MTQKLDDRIAVIVWAKNQDRANGWAKTLNAPIYYINRQPFGSNSNTFTMLTMVSKHFENCSGRIK